jgi:hypothetical protein
MSDKEFPTGERDVEGQSGTEEADDAMADESTASADATSEDRKIERDVEGQMPKRYR